MRGEGLEIRGFSHRAATRLNEAGELGAAPIDFRATDPVEQARGHPVIAEAGRLVNPAGTIVTHPAALDDAPQLYRQFDHPGNRRHPSRPAP